MTTITIVPEKADTYRALAGEKESTGRTVGEALDALTAQLGDDEGGTLVIVQNRKPDEFFTAAQQERLAELIQRSEAGHLSPEEERELESLVEAELVGARERAKVLAGGIARGEEKFDAFPPSYDRFDADEAARLRTLDRVFSDDLKNEWKEIFRSLSVWDKQMLVMYFVEDLTHEEVAERLAISPEEARYRITRLRAVLWSRLRRRSRLSEQTHASAVDSDEAEKAG